MNTKKPKMVETVGAFYYALNSINYDEKEFKDVIKSPVIKKVKVEPEGETVTVRASGQDYDTVNTTSSIELEVETIAFDPEDLAVMKAERITTKGLVFGGGSKEKPYFACGWPVIKTGDGYTYKWYPKCKLTENSEEASTSEETFKEQTSTQKITAYAFNENNEKFVYVDSDVLKDSNVTEEQFFSKVIITEEDFESISSETV